MFFIIFFMAILGEWGDHMTLRALTELTGMAVQLFTKSADGKSQSFMCEPSLSETKGWIPLAFNGHTHSDAVTQLDQAGPAEPLDPKPKPGSETLVHFDLTLCPFVNLTFGNSFLTLHRLRPKPLKRKRSENAEDSKADEAS